jgi:hypothetical protein
MSQKNCPEVNFKDFNILKISDTNWMDDYKNIYAHFHKINDKDHITNLCRADVSLLLEFERLGIKKIIDIPEDFPLGAKQKNQLKATKNNQICIENDSISQFLEKLKFPLYFLDYETLSSAIPMFDGVKPYQDIPFQYSLHVLEGPDKEIKHFDYVHIERTNPIPQLLKKLKTEIKERGNVVCWNESYEKKCNEIMAKIFPEFEEFLGNINSRMIDLSDPFSNDWFIDKNFYGSYSIKKVLPALFPEFTYQNLEVQDGMEARRVWMENIYNHENTIKELPLSEEQEQKIKQIKEYCKLDTLAMVRIYEFLRKFLKN